ncbi:hypothetical protein ACQEUU_37650 [Nonomuraea sp. CA-218870]|uniref:hypothetical protein n=1 Tax=Nonomuraea sp. CA-218870 TaxID=3239998 RepID=UPI003D8B6BBF
MTTTTSYGTWNNRVEAYSLTVEQTVVEALGEFASEYDTDAIATDYRAAINEALPEGISLSGDEFYGPYYRDEVNLDGYPTDEDDRLDFKAIVEGIDFWEIAAKHETA